MIGPPGIGVCVSGRSVSLTRRTLALDLDVASRPCSLTSARKNSELYEKHQLRGKGVCVSWNSWAADQPIANSRTTAHAPLFRMPKLVVAALHLEVSNGGQRPCQHPSALLNLYLSLLSSSVKELPVFTAASLLNATDTELRSSAFNPIGAPESTLLIDRATT